jgi:hypothetical protein
MTSPVAVVGSDRQRPVPSRFEQTVKQKSGEHELAKRKPILIEMKLPGR